MRISMKFPFKCATIKNFLFFSPKYAKFVWIFIVDIVLAAAAVAAAFVCVHFGLMCFP